MLVEVVELSIFMLIISINFPLGVPSFMLSNGMWIKELQPNFHGEELPYIILMNHVIKMVRYV